MAAEPRESQEQREERAAMKAHADATEREAYQYWGYLLQEDKTGTPKLDRLLRGIAEVISRKFEPSDSPDLTPSQIAAWYRSVGGDYDLLFTETAPSSVAFIYRSLGAFHSLQPGPGDDGYSTPTIPALKKQGFVTWQTIQLLLGPEEHVPFLQRAVELDDIPDPETGNIFPKVLPKQCFPEKPDEAMEAWYENVADRLKREAEEELRGDGVADDPRLRTSMDGDGSSADEKTGAYRYFEDPLYRNGRPRPTFMRHVSKEPTRPEYDHGRAVTSRVRHMLNPLNPFASKKKSMPGRYESDSYSDDDATPIAPVPQPGPRYPSHKRPSAPRRESSLSTTDSESDQDQAPSRRRTPVLRSHRSQDPPISQSGYFPAYPEGPRRYSNQHDAVRLEGRGSKATSPQPVYRPTTSPLFATQVAHAQQEAARKYYEPRPALPPRTSYRPVPAPHNVRYGPTGVHAVSPPRESAPHVRERERERDRGHHRRERDAYDMGSGSSGRSRRRHSTDVEYPRERDRDTARTRSHDRVKEDWDEEDAHERERERKSRYEDRGRVRDDSRERTREARTHRYVSGVQDGASGRKHPVVSGPSY